MENYTVHIYICYSKVNDECKRYECKRLREMFGTIRDSYVNSSASKDRFKFLARASFMTRANVVLRIVYTQYSIYYAYSLYPLSPLFSSEGTNAVSSTILLPSKSSLDTIVGVEKLRRDLSENLPKCLCLRYNSNYLAAMERYRLV